MKPNDFITIGVIIAPHGVRGDLRIMPRTDFPERFMHMDACYIDGKEYHVASARFHKQFVLASFKKEIQVRREDLVELPEGRYYIFDMIGLEVQDTKGNVLGTLTDVLQPGANDVYVVSKEGEPDQLFAAIDDVIIDIDMDKRMMIVDPPEWV